MIRKKISRILVPLDGSKNSIRGLETAITIARGCGSTITGLYCIHEQSHSEFGKGSSNDQPSPQMKKFMDAAKVLAAQNAIDFKEKIARGEIGYTIIKTARGNPKHDMIVMGSRGRSSAKQMIFGSISNYVIHTAAMPVVIVK
ncbi:MAG: universal stress protein [Nitrosopumilus sp. B06]|nr:MAG: universal stress protein [Nitrosopumilus sp. D6]RNJ79380.1 MAG: universal stress protein [Nitrosopumilus sp. B06]